MTECAFCRIIEKTIPAHLVYEDAEHVAFLDVAPASTGQTLVVPKKHADYLFDMQDAELARLFAAAKKVAKAIDKSLKPVRTCVVVEGFGVPHVHVRLHPCYERFLRIIPVQEPSDQQLVETAEKIRTAFKTKNKG